MGLFRNLALAIPQIRRLNESRNIIIRERDDVAARLAESERQIRRLNESRNTIIRERDDMAARLAESERRLAAEVELRALTYAPEEIVRAAFRSMLGREISEQDLSHFVNAMNHGMTVDRVLADIAASPEYTLTHFKVGKVSLMRWTASLLDVFVTTSDQLGGPDAAPCQAFWQDFIYQPSFQVDRSLDPFGPAYAAHQMKLYEELAGHPYRPEQDEQCAFDLEQHTAAINPYDHPDATMMGVHLQRLAHVFSCARVRRGELLLDMGCGWGLSSEVAAYLGLRVLGVDINPDFVSLVNRRAARTGYPISAVHGTFDGFSTPEPVDLVMFYECLHHAVNPLAVVSRYAAALRPGGRMMLAGEPINANWWPHWGMRLDALSVYCIRKFGWFESGWSIDHIQEVMRRADLVPVVHSHGDPVVGPAIVAEKPTSHGDQAVGPAIVAE